MVAPFEKLCTDRIARYAQVNTKPSHLCTALASSGRSERSGYVFSCADRVTRLITKKIGHRISVLDHGWPSVSFKGNYLKSKNKTNENETLSNDTLLSFFISKQSKIPKIFLIQNLDIIHKNQDMPVLFISEPVGSFLSFSLQ